MKHTATIHVTREMIEHLLDLPLGVQIEGDMHLHPARGDEPESLVFEVSEEAGGVTAPGKSYSTYYEQNPETGEVALSRLLER